MNNPTQDGKSIDNQSSYTAGMNVHHSLGVYNKAFYNLATTSSYDCRPYLNGNSETCSINNPGADTLAY